MSYCKSKYKLKFQMVSLEFGGHGSSEGKVALAPDYLPHAVSTALRFKSWALPSKDTNQLPGYQIRTKFYLYGGTFMNSNLILLLEHLQ